MYILEVASSLVQSSVSTSASRARACGRQARGYGCLRNFVLPDRASNARASAQKLHTVRERMQYNLPRCHVKYAIWSGISGKLGSRADRVRVATGSGWRPLMPARPITMCGNVGGEAKPYQEGQVQGALEELRKRREGDNVH